MSFKDFFSILSSSGRLLRNFGRRLPEEYFYEMILKASYWPSIGGGAV